MELIFLPYIEIYGLIQGLTEFNLKIISFFLGIDDPGSSLSAIIQIGSVFAIFWYFRKYLKKIQIQKFIIINYLNLLYIGTIPIFFLVDL